jgi:hypothetical protein
VLSTFDLEPTVDLLSQLLRNYQTHFDRDKYTTLINIFNDFNRLIVNDAQILLEASKCDYDAETLVELSKVDPESAETVYKSIKDIKELCIPLYESLQNIVRVSTTTHQNMP